MYGSDNSDDVIVVHLESDPDSKPDVQTLLAQMMWNTVHDVIQETQRLRRDVEILSAMTKALCEAPIAHIFSGTNNIQVWSFTSFTDSIHHNLNRKTTPKPIDDIRAGDSSIGSFES
ncbi:hypothetical protein EI94DRAFT_1710411 [Lactarius quietus]|nr:hypothetical protein EI94DRAFT_1710411 [Lactarius quietus]